jgi:abortive infection bacteriophage resistance protein
MKYTKPPFSTDQHIELLKLRGLDIPDEAKAFQHISNIGYFRFTGYMYHLRDKSNDSHQFFKGVSFDDIISHYQFDKKLRLLIFDYMERIEVALRAKLTDKYSLNHGFYWYSNHKLYDDNNIFNSINEEIREKFKDPQERFLKAFKNKYRKESLPPSNMAMEILTLGKLSRLYKGLSNYEEKMAIAQDFNLPSTILSSWLIYLTNIRNICAHHSRLWNRNLSVDRPVIPTRKKYQFKGTITPNFNTTMYGVISITDRLLSAINPTNSFIDKIIELINQHPINPQSMGFPGDWEANATWYNK